MCWPPLSSLARNDVCTLVRSCLEETKRRTLEVFDIVCWLACWYTHRLDCSLRDDKQQQRTGLAQTEHIPREEQMCITMAKRRRNNYLRYNVLIKYNAFRSVKNEMSKLSHNGGVVCVCVCVVLVAAYTLMQDKMSCSLVGDWTFVLSVPVSVCEQVPVCFSKCTYMYVLATSEM